MQSPFPTLFAYDHWANQQWLERLREIGEVDERARQVFAHLLTSKKLWLMRIQGEDTSGFDFWPTLSFDECDTLIDETKAAYDDYLAGLSEEDLRRAFTYQNSKGETFHTPMQDALMHVITHSHYHRGQVAQRVRQQGHEPIWTDYIVYVRNQPEGAGLPGAMK